MQSADVLHAIFGLIAVAGGIFGGWIRWEWEEEY